MNDTERKYTELAYGADYIGRSTQMEDMLADAAADARTGRELIAREHIAQRTLTVDDIQLIKDQVAPGATDGELRLFVQVCNHTGLDPFIGQIYSIRRRQRIDGQWVEKQTLQVGIDGYRLLARRTGRYQGSTTYWCGEDGVWREVWLERGPPAAAKTEVRVKGWPEPQTAVARWSSYVQTDNAGNPTRFWRESPDNQLGKCSEALALRKAFPAELAGFDSAEVDTADADAIEGTFTEIVTRLGEHGDMGADSPNGDTTMDASPSTAAGPGTDGITSASSAPVPAPNAHDLAIAEAQRTGTTIEEQLPVNHEPGIFPSHPDGTVIDPRALYEMGGDAPRPAPEPPTTAQLPLDGDNAGNYAPATVTPAVAPSSGPSAGVSGGANAPATPNNIAAYMDGLQQANALGIDMAAFEIVTTTITKGELKEKAIALRAAIDAAQHAAHI